MLMSMDRKMALSLMILLLFLSVEPALASERFEHSNTELIFSEDQMQNNDPLIQEMDRYFEHHPDLLEDLMYCDPADFNEVWDVVVQDFYHESTVAKQIFPSEDNLMFDKINRTLIF